MTEAEVKRLAFALLARRDRTRAELTVALVRRGCPDALVAAVVNELEERGYIDDCGLARRYIAYRMSSQPRGRRRLAAELSRRGVGGESLRQALAGLGETELARAALAVAQSKAHIWVGQPEPVRRRRLAAFLYRRGFEPDQVEYVLSQIERGQEGA